MTDQEQPVPQVGVPGGGASETTPLAAPQPGAAGAQLAATAGEAPIRQATLWSDAWRQLRRNPLFIVPAVVIVVFTVMAIWPSLFTSADPRMCDLAHTVERPSADHIFGYDLQGCDYYARVIYGAKVSMFVGIATVAVAGFVAVVLGSLAGFYGGWLDALIARIADIWFALPYTLVAIVALNFLGGDRGLKEVTIVLIVLSWPTMMRLMRSSVLSLRELEYVQAARALGASDLRIMGRHVLPNGIAPVIVYGTITVGIIISVEAVLSFLGVGQQLPAISWGLMISGAQYRILTVPHLLLFPAVFLSILVLAFILLGDALRDALDPRMR
jgi:oligopeptide transport system permease protein